MKLFSITKLRVVPEQLEGVEAVSKRCSFQVTRRVFTVVLACLFLNFFQQHYFSNTRRSNNDFRVYYVAARCLNDNSHAAIYEGALDRNPQIVTAPNNSEIARHAQAIGIPQIEQYLYPPLLADLFEPFALLHPHAAAAIWRACNLLFILITAVLLTYNVEGSVISARFVALLFAILCFFPVHESLGIGQITILMLTLWTAGAVCIARNRSILSALCFALGIWFKVTPVLVVPLFLIWMDRRWLITCLISCLLIGGVLVCYNGMPLLVDSFHVLSNMSGPYPATLNKTIGSMILTAVRGRLFDEAEGYSVAVAVSRQLSLALKIVSLTVYASCLWMVWHSRNVIGYSDRAIAVATFALATLLISPISWRLSYPAAVAPLAFCWLRALKKPPRVMHLGLLAAATVAIGTPWGDVALKVPIGTAVHFIFAYAVVAISLLFCWDTLFHLPDDATTLSLISGWSSLPIKGKMAS